MNDSGRTTGKNRACWWDAAFLPSFPHLTESVSADVCVIGGGIAGLSTAYQLAREGKSVVLLEAWQIGSGATGRTSAHLCNALDDRFTVLEHLFGKEGAQLAAESHAAAVDEIERIVDEEKIDCDFSRVDGYLFLDPHHKSDYLMEEMQAAHRAGLEDVSYLSDGKEAGFAMGPCLKFPRQAQFHPVNYLMRLAEIVTEKGVRIFESTRVESIRHGAVAEVVTDNDCTVLAQSVVVTTNSPVFDYAMLFARQAPNRTYVIAARLPAGEIKKALYWDTASPYHFIRTQTDPQSGGSHIWLIVGGEDHRVGQMPEKFDPFQRLEEWTRTRFPKMGEVAYRWSGQIQEPADSLGFIGLNPSKDNNIYVVTGDSGNGLTNGTLAGMLLRDLILKRPNPWAELYSPSRTPLKSVKDLAMHNVKAASNYLQYVTPGEVHHTEDIRPGEGGIIRRGSAKVAVYRDEQGNLHECSAYCSHLGGILSWNSIEKTWDCSAHGSRFSVKGEVLQGPANCPLKLPAVIKEEVSH